jgi:putative ABC transport system permease protein
MRAQRRRTNADFADEIRAHIELEADRLIAEGVSPDDARAAAERRFGNTLKAQERFHESRRWPWMDELVVDIRHAARGMLKYPLSCVIAIISLAAGIGMTTVTLMVRHVVFLAPPPHYAHPEQLSMVGIGVVDRSPAPTPAAVVSQWMEDPDLAPSLVAQRGSRVADVRADDRVDAVTVRAVTTNVFSVLGVPAALGRTFDSATSGTDGPTPVVLSHRAWRNLFDGRPDAIGRVLWLDDVPHTVIGVMPEFFWFVSMDAPVWTPLDANRLSPTDLLSVVVRRANGVTPIELGERLQAAVSTYAESLPPEQRRIRAAVLGIEGTPIGRNVGPLILVLLATSVLLTLLIACTNVAVQLIAQWTTREHEIAIRASLGASRARIVRGLVAESVLIACAGGALGLSVTLALRAWLLTGDETPHYNLSVDYRIFIVTAAITAFAGLATGLVPALYETRLSQVNPLVRMRLSDRVRQRWRHALVVFEIGVTVALLVVAGALVSAAQRTMSTQPGFDTHPLVVTRVTDAGRMPIKAVLDRLASVAGVASVAAASSVPIVAPPAAHPIALDRSGSAETRAERTFISPAFFDTLGVVLRSGRRFTEQDDVQAPRVAIVNEMLATRLWPNGSPIGEYVWSGEMAYQVVGVAASIKTLALRPPRPAFYLPLAQAADVTRLHFVMRASGDAAPLVETVRREIRDASPAEVVTSTVTVDTILDISSREIRVGTFPMLPLIATGLLLTSAGIFSVLAFTVARRSNELAVRIAIGAERKDLLRLVSMQSARLVGIGTMLGIGGTFALTRLAQGTGNVFDAPGWQAFVIPIAIVIVIGVLATWVPTRRALRIKPASLLRTS